MMNKQIMTNLKEGEPCNHPGCLHHRSHPCEGCGRVTGKYIKKGGLVKEQIIPDEDLKIDRDQLHIECSKQAELYNKYAVLLSAAIKDRDSAKDYFVRAKAKAEIHYRGKNATELGVQKMTESVIAACLNGDPDLADQVKIIRDLEENVRNISAVLNAIEQKESMLGNLITLWAKNYPNWKHAGYEKTQQDIRKNLKKKGE